MTKETYTFIDGAYLDAVYKRLLSDLLGVQGEIDYSLIRSDTDANKVFYYDCVDEIRGKNETDTAFQERGDKKKTQLDKIGRLHGFHVQTGTLRSRKRREQKEVDVLLAVDAMNFAFYGAMKEAKIIAGDLDFRPLVESLVRHGTFVTVYSDPREGSVDLMTAADAQIEMDVQKMFYWSTEAFRLSHPIPIGTALQKLPDKIDKYKKIKSGRLLEGDCVIYELSHIKEYAFAWMRSDKQNRSNPCYFYRHSNLPILEKYVEMQFGIAQWK